MTPKYKTENNISIAIRMKNEGPFIEKTLMSIGQNQKSNNNILVVLDSGSTDEGIEIVEKYTKFIYKIKANEFQFGKSCNQIIEKCETEYVLLLSGHVWFRNPDDLRAAKEIMEKDETIAALYFRQTVDGELGKNYSNYEKLFLKSRFNIKSRYLNATKKKLPISNAAALIRRRIWCEIKFPEVVASEDILWAKMVSKKGYKLYYKADSEVIHNHNETPDSIEKRVRINKIAQYGDKPKIKLAIFNFLKVLLGLCILMRSPMSEGYKYAIAHAKAYIK